MNLLIQFAAEPPTDHVIDKPLWLGLTMHTVTILVVGIVFILAMLAAAKSIATGPESQGNERYLTKGRWAQFVEVVVLYLRNELLVPVLGEKHTTRYLPYLMTLFFFILFMNVFGLFPIADLQHVFGVHKTVIGGAATATITVTGGLAALSFVMIQIHGFRELGVKGYLEHLCGGLVPLPSIFLAPIVVLVFFVEVAGQFIKPAALAIRLFANMVAGHTLMAVLLGFGAAAVEAAGGKFTVAAGGITLVTAVAAVLISFLELFVAFLQAFIFMFLTAVFISLMSHHDEAHDEHDRDHEPTPASVHEPVAA